MSVCRPTSKLILLFKLDYTTILNHAITLMNADIAFETHEL